MEIVAENDTLSVDAKVSPNDIDQLRANQLVLLRFSAFDQRTTPENSRFIALASSVPGNLRHGYLRLLLRQY